jgi:pimeloyl-ACP methyl ester carboxylesterase
MTNSKTVSLGWCWWVLWAGCSSPVTELPGSGVEPIPLTLAAACTDSVESVYVEPTDLDPFDASQRGEIVRCAVDRPLSVEQIEQTLSDANVLDADVKSSVRVYRIRYRTERLPGQEGMTGALVLLPDRPLSRRVPLIVFGHGGVGDAPAAAFSRSDPTSSDALNRVDATAALALASYGYPLIAPDYPGFVEGGTPGNTADDEAHSLLDGTRAFEKLVTKIGLSEQVVLVGHSQGGHAVLAAQAHARSYGMSGRLDSVVPLAPAWYAARTHLAYLSKELGYNTTDHAVPITISLSYLFSHAEFYDGPGAGIALIQPAKLGALAMLAESRNPFAELALLGRTAYDFLEPAFLDVVATCALTSLPQDCSTELAKTWQARFRADRPTLDPRGADILVWQAANDVPVPPTLGRCAVDKIMADLSVAKATARVSVCGDRDADHNDLVSRNVSWVARWIESRTLHTPAPSTCPGQEALAPEGETLACPDPPGNID